MPDPTTPLDLEAIRERLARWDSGDDTFDADIWTAFGDIGALLAALAEAQRERDEARDAQIVVQCDDPEHAERDAMRQELAAVADAIGDDPKADWSDLADRVAQDWAEMASMRNEADERAELMRPVVEKARRYVAELVGLDDLEAAVDTYETQTGGTE